MPAFTQRARGFETTSWSLILAASGDENSDTAPALADLCRRYWAPVQAFVRSRGYSPEEADDLTQSFFARLLEKKYVAQAERSRGRFRTFLLTAVTHFLAHERERAATRKRGGDRQHVAIDDTVQAAADTPGPLTPEQLFDKRWAMTVVAEVVEAVRAQARAEGREDLFERLLPFVTGEAPRNAYSEVSRATGTSEGALRVAAHRERLRFREQLQRTIASTVLDPEQIEDEIRFLIRAVSVEGSEP